MCPKSLTDTSAILKVGTTVDEFKQMIFKLIESRLNHTRTVESIIQRISLFTDSNQDGKLNHPEAATLWSLLNTKHTFYMLVLGEQKAFIPQIKDFCGNFVELEEVVESLSSNDDNCKRKVLFLFF